MGVIDASSNDTPPTKTPLSTENSYSALVDTLPSQTKGDDASGV
jgi:hypothetical protein